MSVDESILRIAVRNFLDKIKEFQDVTTKVVIEHLLQSSELSLDEGYFLVGSRKSDLKDIIADYHYNRVGHQSLSDDDDGGGDDDDDGGGGDKGEVEQATTVRSGKFTTKDRSTIHRIVSEYQEQHRIADQDLIPHLARIADANTRTRLPTLFSTLQQFLPTRSRRVSK
jgi:hypothetical protein